MFSKFTTVLLLATLLVMVSCSQKGSNVKLEISHNFAFGNSAALQAVSGGGLMVWGHNTNGSSFAQTLSTSSDNLNLSLPNGSWNFYAMAWDGTTNYSGSPATDIPFGGVQRCAKSAVVNLSGANAIVDLSLNNGTCADSIFTGNVPTTTSSGNIYLGKTKFSFCRGIGQIASATDICSDSRLDQRQKERKAWIGSFRVNFKNFTAFNGSKTQTGKLVGNCVEMVGDLETSPNPPTTAHSSMYGASTHMIPGLPAGGPGLPFQMEIEMFPGNTKCDITANGAVGLRGVLFKNFDNGIAAQEIGSNKYFATASAHKQFLQVTSESICSGRNGTSLGDHPFAAGEGTQEHPYILCSVPQFHAINTLNTNLSKHYKLEANLDFNPYSNGLAGTGVVPSTFGCLESGSNFIPLGYYSANCSSPGSPLSWGAIENFTGTFNGGAYKLSNLRLRDQAQSNLGLFASVNGTTEVGNFNLENVEIEGAHTVGLIAGISQGQTDASSILFWNINANKVDIQAREENPAQESIVGGFIGRLDNASLFRISIKDSKVRGPNSKVGGIIGHSTYVNLNEVISEVNIDGNSPISPKYYIGGVIGLADNTTMDFVKHEGAIYTNGQKVGGIVGSATSNTTLTNFYANSHVTTNDSSPTSYLGGVVGYWGSTGSSFGPGYTMSIVRSDCMSACTQGSVAAYIGSQPGTQGLIYTLPGTETGKGGSAPTFTQETPLSSIADMRLLSNFATFSQSGTYNWVALNGEYPRFDFEYHLCTSPSVSGSGAGTAASPKIVCNEAQYLALGSAAAGTYHRLAGNIRLSIAGTTQFDIPTFNVVLDGSNKFLLGGYADVSGSSPVGHIGTIGTSAIIKNLKVHGMGRKSNDNSTTIANPHGAFAAVNNGKIYNVDFWTDSTYTRFGAAVIGINGTTGEMKNISVAGRLRGFYDSFASVAVLNNGLIERVRTNNELVCVEGAGCYHFAGLVVQNTGSIKKSEMGSRMHEQPGNVAYETSMLVDTNSGLIEDVVVSEHSEFQVMSDAYYFHRVNSSPGILRRVVNNGSLKANDVTFSSTLLNFPTETSAIATGTGTHVDVYRSGGRTGKLLLKDVNFSCSTADQVNLSAWTGMSDYSAWNSALLGTGYETLGSKLIVELDFNGMKSTERVLDYNDATNEFAVTAGRCSSGSNGKASLWYTTDLAVDLSGNGTSGANLLQYASYWSNYSPAFQAVMWDHASPAHHAEKMSYYSYILGISTTPVAPRIWELEDDGRLSIFELDH